MVGHSGDAQEELIAQLEIVGTAHAHMVVTARGGFDVTMLATRRHHGIELNRATQRVLPGVRALGATKDLHSIQIENVISDPKSTP